MDDHLAIGTSAGDRSADECKDSEHDDLQGAGSIVPLPLKRWRSGVAAERHPRDALKSEDVGR